MKNQINKEIIIKINKIREKGNFQTVKKVIGEDKLKEFIHSIYPKFSIPEIEKITGIPDSTLSHWFKRLEIPFIRNHVDTLSMPGDLNSEIVIEKDGKTKKTKTVNITPDLAYLIGFALGDGTIQKYMVEFFNKDENLKEHIFNLLKPHGPITENTREDDLWRLRLSSVKIANLIKKDKIIREDTLNYIFKDDKLTRKFIAAFWDAEGHISKRSNYYDILISNTNDKIMDYITKFLIKNKIKFSIKYIKIGRLSKIKGVEVRGCKSGFKIRIFKDSIKDWAKLIGIHMLHSKKSNIVKEILGGNSK
ncbi:MAG: LAGLIDADG family homing endonuclease [Nanoarchaeota archaeon]|nr:LAGLIDADG family homing endonuclease [Nanoarchaeota archaeon]